MNQEQPAKTQSFNDKAAQWIEQYQRQVMAIIAFLGLVGGIVLTQTVFHRSYQPLTFIQAQTIPTQIPTPTIIMQNPTLDEEIQVPVDGKININTASKEELMSLPGIGPTYAQRIIELRPYTSLEQLLNIKGIGEKRFAEIKPKITM